MFMKTPSDHLLPVYHNPDFAYDYPNIIGNICAIENITNPRRSHWHDTTSIIMGESNTIKIMHHLFVVCILFVIVEIITNPIQENKSSSKSNDNTPFLEYTINDWPVNASNECYLNEIKVSHSVHPIPAYDIKGNLISPLDYEEKLGGAIAHVCFSIVHYLIKHAFNAIIQDITVMRLHTTIATPSLKHIFFIPK